MQNKMSYLRKKELADGLGLQFDEVNDLFSEETLESMMMVDLIGGSGVGNNCVGDDCSGKDCTEGEDTGDDCVGGGCTGKGCTTKPTSKPTAKPTPASILM